MTFQLDGRIGKEHLEMLVKQTLEEEIKVNCGKIFSGKESKEFYLGLLSAYSQIIFLMENDPNFDSKNSNTYGLIKKTLPLLARVYFSKKPHLVSD
jgi:hypothetical protein